MAGILSPDRSLWLVTVTTWIIATTAQECPTGWDVFEDHCYLFVSDPVRTHAAAAAACELDGAYLLALNSEGEHLFVSQWLGRHSMDSVHRTDRWWTSGIGAGSHLQWEGEGLLNTLDESTKWAEEEDKPLSDQRVVYRFSPVTTTFLWGRQIATVQSPYICEISQQQAFTVDTAQRDFSFGTELTESAYAPRGPRFVVEPTNLLVVGQVLLAFLECVASGRPHPSYAWYRLTHDGPEEISRALDPRYSLTNGRFFFQSPMEEKDAGEYYCTASNRFGSIRSYTVRVSFGYLQEFSNDPPGVVRADQYQGAYMDCMAPKHNPAVTYQWFRGDDSVRFIRTQENPHLFVSKNGGLYFSETQDNSQGVYHCIVTLAAPQGVAVATTQPPSRVSLGIFLEIKGDSATSFGPEIHNDFPAVFPSNPLRGSDISLECFAYGKLPLRYIWKRDNGPLPKRAVLQDLGRTLFIPNSQLEDSGNYTCRVERSAKTSAEKTLALVIRAVPFFIFPLRDQHVDVGSTFSIRCEAMAVPLPTFAWLKNGEKLNSTWEDVEVNGNVVTVMNADPKRHSGMYECIANNVYGTRVSTCQVRVLEFKPTFAKRPLDYSQMVTVGGNATIVCQPEAAPRATITWLKNGEPLRLTPGGGGRVTMLTNGNLRLTEIQLSDQGNYTCRAENSKGSAESSGLLTVVSRTIITVPPTNTEVIINSTAFLSCEASYDSRKQDLVYSWSFNGHLIDPEEDPTFVVAKRAGLHGLYVRDAQFINTGWYQCSAVTVDDKASAAGYLTVKGPPGEPAGLAGHNEGMDVVLTWWPGIPRGADIIYYIIEHKSDFFPVWRVKVDKLKEEDAFMPEDPNRRTYTVTDLSPGSSYSFRVSAVNTHGIGDVSLPSGFFRVPDAPPLLAPEKISSIISKVGTLAFAWTKLNPEDLTGQDQGYTLYWRKKNYDVLRTTRWQMATVDSIQDWFVTLVGAENYYLEYEVKIAAFNYLGHGPNSSVTIIMSQESMPLATPQNVNGEEVNATAIMVYWDPVEFDREYVKGKVLGFRINWWAESDPSFISFVHIYCEDCTEGMVVGLNQNDDFWVNVQVFNTAGLGPKGEDSRISTGMNTPYEYPKYVAVFSQAGNSVLVTWQGVTIGQDEAPLNGYKMRWWPATENILAANDTVIEEKRVWGVIDGVEEGIVYALRVLAYNDGGDGKKSPTVFFTLEGRVMYNPETTEVLATGSYNRASVWTLLIGCILYALL